MLGVSTARLWGLVCLVPALLALLVAAGTALSGRHGGIWLFVAGLFGLFWLFGWFQVGLDRVLRPDRYRSRQEAERAAAAWRALPPHEQAAARARSAAWDAEQRRARREGRWQPPSGPTWGA